MEKIYSINLKIVFIALYLFFLDICFANLDTLRILNYNIYGLNRFFTSLFPNKIIDKSQDRIKSIFEESNKYDVVFFQENWNYQDLIVKVMKNHKIIIAENTNFSIKKNPKRSSGLNLAISNKFNIDHVEEGLYSECNGYFSNYNDCLASKGFIYSLISNKKYKMNLYVTHLDAGNSYKDIAARKSQLEELSVHINNLDNNYFLIVCGDLNIDYYTSATTIDEFIEKNDLNILRWDKNQNVDEMIDYVFFKNSKNEISLIEFGINNILINKSDHFPIEFIITLEDSN